MTSFKNSPSRSKFQHFLYVEAPLGFQREKKRFFSVRIEREVISSDAEAHSLERTRSIIMNPTHGSAVFFALRMYDMTSVRLGGLFVILRSFLYR